MDILQKEKELKDEGLSVCIRDGILYCSVGDTDFSIWQNGAINEPALNSCRRIKKFYDKQDDMVKDGYGGRYAAVDNDLSILIFSTETEALDYAAEKQDVFVLRIGISNRLFFDEGSIVFRGQAESYLNFAKEAGVLGSQELVPTFAFCAGRAFLKLSFVVPNSGWRTAWFILDTGAADSYIRECDRGGLVDNTSGAGGYIVCGYSKKFVAQKSEEAPNTNIREFNLLGTNFIDQYVYILDALSKSIVLLKREALTVKQYAP
jgi:hypothetical protein